jgi:hypothetical protein
MARLSAYVVVALGGAALLCSRAPSLLAEQRPLANLFASSTAPIPAALMTDRTIVRVRTVIVNVDALRPSSTSLVLNLFDDAQHTAVLDRIDPTSRGFVWAGHIRDVEGSTVTFAIDNQVLYGSILLPTASYVVRSAGDGLYTVAQVDQAAFPRDGPPIPGPPDDAGPPPRPGR